MPREKGEPLPEESNEAQDEMGQQLQEMAEKVESNEDEEVKKRQEMRENPGDADPKELANLLREDYLGPNYGPHFDVHIIHKYNSSVWKITDEFEKLVGNPPPFIRAGGERPIHGLGYFKKVVYQTTRKALDELRQKKDEAVLEAMEERDEFEDRDFEAAMKKLKSVIDEESSKDLK